MSNRPNSSQTRSTPQTLQQERAAAAWSALSAYNGDTAKYASLIRGLPALIQTDGLGQALAFLLAKDGGNRNHHGIAYEHISDWVMRREFPNVNQDLFNHLLTCSSADYRRAASEALAYLSWLKRFVEAKGWT